MIVHESGPFTGGWDRTFDPPDPETADHDRPLLAGVSDTCTWWIAAIHAPGHRDSPTRGRSGRILAIGSGTGAVVPDDRKAIDG